MAHCLFCKIVKGEAQAEIVYQDDQALAFRDINPQAPVHVLVIPRRHIESLALATAEDTDLLGHLLHVGKQVAEQEQILQQGYRTVINTNRAAGQTVYHVHVHIIGGRALGWPPG